MRKLLFYLTNQQMSAYAFNDGVLAFAASFEQDEAGQRDFGAFLAGAPTVASYLVVDVIEEDFQRDTAPHVTGRTRQVLVERKLSQLYRDTPFRHATLQGRDKAGRKDDRYLFNALTKPELPRAWLALMQTHAVALVGIYSLASLSQLMFDKLALGNGPVLLVSHQSSGLRQSFFSDGELRFSRLTPLFDHASARLAEAFRVETNKTRQFLASTRLLARGAQVRVVVLAGKDSLAALAPHLVDTPDASYHPQALAQAGAAIRAGQFNADSVGDALYLALLASTRVPTHFALRDQKHFYQLLQARSVLYVLSGVLLLGALAWTTVDVLDVFQLRREQARLEQEALVLEARFRGVAQGMPVTAIAPNNLRLAVTLEELIRQNVPLPNVQLAVLSDVLDGLPELQVQQLQWQVVDPATLEAAPSAAAPADAAIAAAPLPAPALDDFAPVAALLGIPSPSAQTVLVQGQVLPFQGNYRSALESVALLKTRLNSQPGVRADILVQPLDTRPTVKLDNVAGAAQDYPPALFTVKITWKR